MHLQAILTNSLLFHNSTLGPTDKATRIHLKPFTTSSSGRITPTFFREGVQPLDFLHVKHNNKVRVTVSASYYPIYWVHSPPAMGERIRCNTATKSSARHRSIFVNIAFNTL
jgi:hypothetical protein